MKLMKYCPYLVPGVPLLTLGKYFPKSLCQSSSRCLSLFSLYSLPLSIPPTPSITPSIIRIFSCHLFSAMCVCMCVCVCVCVCLWIGVCVYVCVCDCVLLYLCVYVCLMDRDREIVFLCLKERARERDVCFSVHRMHMNMNVCVCVCTVPLCLY